MRAILASVFCVAIGCGGVQTQDNAEPATATAPTTEATTDPAATTDGTSLAVEEGQDAKPEDAPAAGGRMAFVTCDAEHRPEVCTKEYRPVCAEVDNGVRCITTPCDSTDQRNFGNACMACADPKVTGHWPVACEALGNDAR